MADEDTTLADLKSEMRRFVSERDWEKYHTPRSLAISVSIEAAELLELFQWHEGAEPTADEILSDPRLYDSVKDEIADVFLYLIEMCNILDIDLSEAVRIKLSKNREKYPAELYRGRARLDEDI